MFDLHFCSSLFHPYHKMRENLPTSDFIAAIDIIQVIKCHFSFKHRLMMFRMGGLWGGSFFLEIQVT